MHGLSKPALSVPNQANNVDIGLDSSIIARLWSQKMPEERVQGLKVAGASIMVEMLRSRCVKARKIVEAKQRKPRKGCENVYWHSVFDTRKARHEAVGDVCSTPRLVVGAMLNGRRETRSCACFGHVAQETLNQRRLSYLAPAHGIFVLRPSLALWKERITDPWSASILTDFCASPMIGLL